MSKEKILAIMPISIGGRLTTSSFIDGFIENGFDAFIYDELKDSNIVKHLKDNYSYIIGYDFSPIKIKIDYNLKFPCIAYFSDDIHSKTSGAGFKEYYQYINNKDIAIFYWDRELTKKEKLFYQPHFVNTKIYKNFLKPTNDVLFMGRLDTELRLNTYLELNKRLKDTTFQWFAIEKHYLNALSRIKTQEEKQILESTYKGFIDNEKDMAYAINNSRIIYNINAQGKTSLNYRTIQTLACERLIISDEREELDLFNNTIPTYKNINELEKKIRYYLKNKEEYNYIVKNNRSLIQSNHNSTTCVKNMLKKIKEKQSFN